jgi:dTDP-4-amino-4,6-dideoxygalactose transaminase
MTISHSKPYISINEQLAVRDLLDKSHLAKGPVNEELEKALRLYFSANECMCFPSASIAIFAALKNMIRNSDDEVILPTYVCDSVLKAILEIGAVPVLCDIGKDWNITVAAVEKHISSKTKAIIVPHIFGLPAEVNHICDLGIPVIEDCAQSFGACLGGKKLGTFGNYGAFSFNATKCISAGEGGALISTEYSINTDFFAIFSDVQAALALSQLEKYNDFLERRKKIAGMYFSGIKQDLTDKLRAQRENSVFFRFPLDVDKLDFDRIQAEFVLQGVAVRRGVDVLLHRKLALSDTDFPNAVKTFNRTLSVPIYPALQDEEAEKIIEAVNAIL